MNAKYLFRQLLLICFLSLSQKLVAQLSPLQPEQDCINAIPVCQEIFFQPSSYTGEGVIEDEIDQAPSCLDSGEKNDVWYTFKVVSDGEIAFTITPNNLFDDYDWAVYNLTNAECSDIFSESELEVSCNWSPVRGATGPNGLGPGGFNNPFNPTIPVDSGEVYVVNVSNFSSTNFGYRLDFSNSTAVIAPTDGTAPEMEVNDTWCAGTPFQISFSENVVCSTVEPSDFTLTGPNGSYTITEIISNECSNGANFDSDFEIRVTPEITEPGEYQLSLVGQVLDLCNNPAILATQDISILEIADFSFDLSALCLDSCVTFNSTGATIAPNQLYRWDFGPNASPRISFFQDPGCIEFSQDGTQEVTLTVSSDVCNDTLTREIFIDSSDGTSPTLNVDDILCVYRKLTVSFSENVLCETVDPSDFEFIGDGGPYEILEVLSAECEDNNGYGQTFELLLNSPIPTSGQYQLSFNGEVEDLCDNPSLPSVHNPELIKIDPDFTFDLAAICQDTCITFTYVGEVTDPNQRYMWDFGPNAFPRTSPLESPPCIEFNQAGIQTISLTLSTDICSVTEEKTIEVYERPQINMEREVVICEGDESITLEPTITGGMADYIFQWSCNLPNNGDCGIDNPNIQNPTVTPNIELQGELSKSTTYYLEVTDGNGCSSFRDSAVVDLRIRPKADAGSDQTICAIGPGVFLQGAPASDNEAPTPFTYEWSPADGLSEAGAVSPFARPDATTEYTLTVTSINGCESIPANDPNSTTTVFVDSLPVVEAGQDTVMCQGDTIQLFGSATVAGPNYDFVWTPANTGYMSDPTSPSPEISPNFTTLYFLVATSLSNGCTSLADSVRVTVSSTPTVSAGPNRSICLGEDIQLQGSASGDPNAVLFNYSWTPSIGLDNPNTRNPIASPDTTTTYELIASSNFGCGSNVASMLLTVKPSPIADIINNDTLVCQGDPITLSATSSFTTTLPANTTYSWSPDSSIISNANMADVIAVPFVSTDYIVTASISGDCPSTAMVRINVSSDFNTTANADKDEICSGESVQLSALGGFGTATYEWIPSSSVSSSTSQNTAATPSETTTYQVVLTEAACTDTAEVTIKVNPTPNSDYISSEPNGCEGLSVNFIENTENAVAFIWDFGDGSPVNNEANPIHVYNQPGTYPVTLTAVGVNGCESSTTAVSVTISPSVEAGFSTNPSPGTEIFMPNATISFTDISTNGTQWLWDFGDGTGAATQSPTHTYSEPGEYQVVLTVNGENGCIDQFALGPYVILEPELFIPNVFSPNEDGVNDAFVIRYRGDKRFTLEVFDRWGNKVYSASNPTDSWNGLKESGELAKEGVYYYSLQIGEESYAGNVTLLR